MPRLLTRRCPECGGECTVPTCPHGHDGCCPCVKVGTTCPECGGHGEVWILCGNCREPLEVGEETECRACKEALNEGGDEMNPKDTKQTPEELAKAARKGAEALDFYLSGVVDGGASISLGCKLPIPVVRALAKELGTESSEVLYPHLDSVKPATVIVSLHTRIGGIDIYAQGDRPATSDDYGAMPVHPPQTECLECSGPLKNVAGSDYDKGLCLACTEERAREQNRKATEKWLETEDIRGDVLRDAAKDGVSA